MKLKKSMKEYIIPMEEFKKKFGIKEEVFVVHNIDEGISVMVETEEGVDEK